MKKNNYSLEDILKNTILNGVYSRYVLRVYRDDEFIGYVKDYRFHRNKKYRFNKTKNVINASIFLSKSSADVVKNKLDNFRDKLCQYKAFTFKVILITSKEIRLSKLNLLNKVIIREGIFKNRIL